MICAVPPEPTDAEPSSVLPEPIEVDYDAIGVSKGNVTLKDWLNVALFSLHSGGWVNETWEKWFKGPMTVKIVPNPFF